MSAGTRVTVTIHTGESSVCVEKASHKKHGLPAAAAAAEAAAYRALSLLDPTTDVDL